MVVVGIDMIWVVVGYMGVPEGGYQSGYSRMAQQLQYRHLPRHVAVISLRTQFLLSNE